MKIKRTLFSLSALIVSAALLLASRAGAQTFTNLHICTPSSGAYPTAGLTASGNILYGTTMAGGGGSNGGTMYRINRDGTGYTNLYFRVGTNGGSVFGAMVLSGGTLYGVGATIFALNTNGTDFTNLHVFSATVYDPIHEAQTNSDGVSPWGGLLLLGNTLYGTARAGGILGGGTVFKINTNGTGFTVLHSFPPSDFISTNDGAWPRGTLILSGNTLYGTTQWGGPYHYTIVNGGDGALFAINTDGTGFTNLHNFNGATDGAQPWGGLLLLGNTLYGTTSEGGIFSAGTVFKVNTNGTGFTNLHNFTGQNGPKDGEFPTAGLISSGNTLYGTTLHGGIPGNGTVFAINSDGTGFTNLHVFAVVSPANNTGDGSWPYGGVILLGNTIYGAAAGASTTPDYGSLFAITLPPPPLTILPSGSNVVLTWPTYAPGVTLQSTPNLVSPTGWTTNYPAPTIVSGQNAVTNSATDPQKFYRLSQ